MDFIKPAVRSEQFILKVQIRASAQPGWKGYNPAGFFAQPMDM